MTMTTGQISRIYFALNGFELTELDGKEKYTVVKNMYLMKSIAETFDAFQKEYPQKVKPKGWDEIEPDYIKYKKEKAEGKCSYTEEVRNMLDRMEMEYITSINIGVGQEAAVEHDIELSLFSEDAFERLLSKNKVDCNTLMLLADNLIMKKAAEEKKD